jgi:hypothetical protein
MACANGTWLFRLAQEWYTTNPGEQIPHEVWATKVQEAVLQNDSHGAGNERFDISAHDWLVTWVSPDMIPVLAAVTLGFSTKELSKVVQHHNIDRVKLTQCSVIEDFIDERTDLRPEDACRFKIGRWTLVEKVMNAIFLDPDAVKGLVEDIFMHQLSSEIKLACLLSDIPDLWASKAIDTRLEKLRSGATDLGYFQFPFIDIGTFRTLDDVHDFSNDQLLKILERSGVMTLGAIREMGFHTDFFFELFEELASPSYPDASEDYEELWKLGEPGEPNSENLARALTLGEPKYKNLVSAINSVECPEQLGRFNDRIREVMSDIDHNSLVSGKSALDNLEVVLDPIKYADVMNDIVLKINLLSMQGMHQPRQRWEGPAYDAIYCEPSLLLSKLARQLMETLSSDFNRTHFQTLSRILKFSRAEQDIEPIDMKCFVLKLMDAFDAYLKKGNYDSNGREIHYVKNRTADHLGLFLQYAADMSVNLDFSRVESLSDASKLLLAKNGFDLKRLPRLSNRDLGDVLSDRLGL